MSPLNEVKDCDCILFYHKHLETRYELENSSHSLDLVGCYHSADISKGENAKHEGH